VVESKDAKVRSHLAPRGERPCTAPAVKRERPNDARGGELASEAGVVELHGVAADAGGVQQVEQLAIGGGHMKTGRIEQNFVQAVSELRRKHGLDARQGGACGGCVLGAAPGLDQARAQHERGEFFRREHERW
jgi:hypothetical protein